MRRSTVDLSKNKTLIIVLTAVFLFLPVIARAEGYDNYASVQDPAPALQVHVFDVGQGLSVVLSCDDHYLLYDGGPGTASSKVVSYLQSHAPGKLDYVIASHYDEDHLNGVIGALHAFQVDTLVAPNYSSDAAIYQSFIRAAEENGVPITYAQAGQIYNLGSAAFQILMPLMPTYLDENDYSVVIRAWNGNTSVMITGDCTTVGENDMLLAQENVDSDILIVGHHGSASSTSQEFLNAVSPSAAVISCGADNPYGHPSWDVMNRLFSAGIPMWRTDEQGDIDFFLNGDAWHYESGPSGDYNGRYPEEEPPAAPAEVAEPVREMPVYIPEEEPQGNARTYVLNNNTFKFHYPDCGSVNQMNPKNREYVEASREEIISWGYDPCKNCNP